ncbi:MAG: GlsB/YeaQ/YmgE family stress response membrane protein [Thermoanaerobaculia bacterium]
MFEAMGVLSWIAIGLLAGAVGKFLLPGKDPGGMLVTIGIGIVGAVLGGFLATLLGFGGLSGFDIRSFIVATLGSIVFLIVLRAFKKR